MPLLLLVSANFIFYITYVQFGLLRMMEGSGHPISSLGLPLALMAVSGALSSIVTGCVIDRLSVPLRRVFNISCILSIAEGIAAISSAVIVYGQPILPYFFAYIGLLMGINGVMIIRSVEAWPAERRGVMAGCAMAAVYLASNIIAGFVIAPEKVALINGLLTAAVGVFCISLSREMRISVDSRKNRTGFLKTVLIIATLVAVDSFMFHAEISKKEIYHYTWEGRWLWNGMVHAVAALAAGVIWGRRGGRPIFAVTLSAFVLSLSVMTFLPLGPVTGLVSTIFYNTAVSFYGILLLVIWFYTDSRVGVGVKIGVGMGVAGWLASPIGIFSAMKMISGPVPLLFIGPLGIMIVLVLVMRED